VRVRVRGGAQEGRELPRVVHDGVHAHEHVARAVVRAARPRAAEGLEREREHARRF